ncbi:MAG: glycosyltransferase [Verrucomicrobiota bacterium]|nr:glycosyltransferase [Verrucomicrobiota bacterium]
MNRELKVAVAVLNWNGIFHLEHLMPTLCEAVKVYGKLCPIIILDNRSTEGDREWLAQHYPQVEVMLAPTNDYLYSYNWLMDNRDEDVVVFLNNDLRVAPDFLAPLLEHFVDDEVFAVGAKSYDWDGKIVTVGPYHARQHHGWIYFENRTDLIDVPRPTFFSCGGFMAVSRKKFLKLKGFDPLFRPAYFEETDLCYRAWQMGWKVLYDPRSVVFHRENGSIAGRAAQLMATNHLLFQWKHFRKIQTIIKRYIYTAYQIRNSSCVVSGMKKQAYQDACTKWQTRADSIVRTALIGYPPIFFETIQFERDLL